MFDPTSIIISALASGAAASLKDTVSEAVKDAYTGLRSLIIQKFKGNPKAEMAFTEHEKDPETWEKPLAQAINETGVNKNDEVLSLAKEMLKVLDTSKPGGTKYSVKADNITGAVIGDNSTVTMSFDDRPPKAKKK